MSFSCTPPKDLPQALEGSYKYLLKLSTYILNKEVSLECFSPEAAYAVFNQTDDGEIAPGAEVTVDDYQALIHQGFFNDTNHPFPVNQFFDLAKILKRHGVLACPIDKTGMDQYPSASMILRADDFKDSQDQHMYQAVLAFWSIENREETSVLTPQMADGILNSEADGDGIFKIEFGPVEAFCEQLEKKRGLSVFTSCL